MSCAWWVCRQVGARGRTDRRMDVLGAVRSHWRGWGELGTALPGDMSRCRGRRGARPQGCAGGGCVCGTGGSRHWGHLGWQWPELGDSSALSHPGCRDTQGSCGVWCSGAVGLHGAGSGSAVCPAPRGPCPGAGSGSELRQSPGLGWRRRWRRLQPFVSLRRGRCGRLRAERWLPGGDQGTRAGGAGRYLPRCVTELQERLVHGGADPAGRRGRPAGAPHAAAEAGGGRGRGQPCVGKLGRAAGPAPRGGCRCVRGCRGQLGGGWPWEGAGSGGAGATCGAGLGTGRGSARRGLFPVRAARAALARVAGPSPLLVLGHRGCSAPRGARLHRSSPAPAALGLQPEPPGSAAAEGSRLSPGPGRSRMRGRC